MRLKFGFLVDIFNRGDRGRYFRAGPPICLIDFSMGRPGAMMRRASTATKKRKGAGLEVKKLEPEHHAAHMPANEKVRRTCIRAKKEPGLGAKRSDCIISASTR